MTAHVQAWSKQVSSFIHIPTLIGAIQLKPTDEAAQELRNTVLVDQEAIELVPFPECVTVARRVLLEAHTEMLDGLDAYVSGLADVSNAHVDKSLHDLQQYAEELQYVLDHFAEA
jgi:hypothetical protein